MTNTVSVIIPCADNAARVKNALRSAREQSLSELELICVDNGVSDECARVIAEITATDKRVKRVAVSQNANLASALNVGLDAASGEYICFLKPQGEFFPDFVKTMREALIKEGTELAVCAKLNSHKDSAKAGYGLQHYVNLPFSLNAKTVSAAQELDPADVLRVIVDLSCVLYHNAGKLKKLRFDESLNDGSTKLFLLELLLTANRFSSISETLYLEHHEGEPVTFKEPKSFSGGLLIRICAMLMSMGLYERFKEAFMNELVDRALSAERVNTDDGLFVAQVQKILDIANIRVGTPSLLSIGWASLRYHLTASDKRYLRNLRQKQLMRLVSYRRFNQAFA